MSILYYESFKDFLNISLIKQIKNSFERSLSILNLIQNCFIDALQLNI